MAEQVFAKTGAGSAVSQAFTVPVGVTSIFVECWGGQNGATNGNGSFASATITTTPGETLRVHVAGAAEASDVRRSADALANRLVVAGGGGTGGYNEGTYAQQPAGYPYSSVQQGAGITAATDGSGSAGGSGGYLAANYGPYYTTGGAGTLGFGGAGGISDHTVNAGLYARSYAFKGGDGYYGGGGGGSMAAVDQGYQLLYRGFTPAGRGSSYVGGGTGGVINTDVRAGDGVVRLTWTGSTNSAPNVAAQQNPVGSPTLDRTVALIFQWAFSDPNAGDTQSRWKLEARLQGSGTLLVNQDQSTSASTYTLAGSTLAAGAYEWRIVTYDSSGAIGPWSTWEPFVMVNAVAAPTITAPANGSTVTTGTATATWTVTSQDAYEIYRVNAGGATVWTSGIVINSAARSYVVPFSINSVTESLKVRVRVGGLWSASATITLNIAYLGPMVAIMSITPEPSSGSVQIAITNPTPTGGAPAATVNDLFVRLDPTETTTVGERRAGDAGIRIARLDPNLPYVDRVIAAGVRYQYRVRSIAAATGLSTDSEWSSPALFLTGTQSVSTPSATALRIAGDICVVAAAALDDWSPATPASLADKWGVAGNRAWLLRVFTDGTLQWFTTADGTTTLTMTSTANLAGLANGTLRWIAVTHDVDNGASGHSVRFWTSPTGATWTQLGSTVTTATVTSIFATTASTQPVRVGAIAAGKVLSFSLRNGIGAAGIVGGTEVASWTPLTTTDPYGNTWTVTGTPTPVVGAA